MHNDSTPHPPNLTTPAAVAAWRAAIAFISGMQLDPRERCVLAHVELGRLVISLPSVADAGAALVQSHPRAGFGEEILSAAAAGNLVVVIRDEDAKRTMMNRLEPALAEHEPTQG